MPNPFNSNLPPRVQWIVAILTVVGTLIGLIGLVFTVYALSAS